MYPAAMFTGTGAVASYDLKGDFTVTGYPVSCVDFATPSQCAPAIPLATSAGDLGDIYAGMKLDFVSRRESTELAPYMTLLSLLILGLGVTVSVVRTGRVVSA